MYRRPILCTLCGAVDFLNVLKKGCWGGGGKGVLLVIVGKKYWYIMFYITYQYFTLETNIKFASAGDQTRVACVTGGHST